MADAFDREISLIVNELKSPKARSRMLASFAREQIDKTKIENETALGRSIRNPRVSVDGRLDAPLGSVKPDGAIVADFNVEGGAVAWIVRELGLTSPELTGAYERSHTVYANGVEVAAGTQALPDAKEFVIVSDLAYAKKLDPKDGLPARSKQAPKGVYAAVAAVAARRFRSEAEVRFTFREVPLKDGGSTRNPAIIVRPLLWPISLSSTP